MRTIIYTNGKNPDFINLCQQLDNNLNEVFGVEKQEVYNQYNLLHDIHDVWIVYESGIPVGCAAFKQYEDNIVEIKRVFVKPEHRGKGISKVLMESLEKEAAKKGYKTLILETGKRLETAINLYQNRGYTVIENYGQYRGLTESVCMQKNLSEDKKVYV